jgi:hypothetical protein
VYLEVKPFLANFVRVPSFEFDDGVFLQSPIDNQVLVRCGD